MIDGITVNSEEYPPQFSSVEELVKTVPTPCLDKADSVLAMLNTDATIVPDSTYTSATLNSASPIKYFYGIKSFPSTAQEGNFTGELAIPASADGSYYSMILISFKGIGAQCIGQTFVEGVPVPSFVNSNAEFRNILIILIPNDVNVSGLAQFFGDSGVGPLVKIEAQNVQLNSKWKFSQLAPPMQIRDRLYISQGTRAAIFINVANSGTSTISVEVARFSRITGAFANVEVVLRNPQAQMRSTLAYPEASGCVVIGEPTTTSTLGSLFVNTVIRCPETETLSTGAIVGIVIGGVALIAVLIVAIIGILYAARKKKKHMDNVKRALENGNE